MIKWVVECARCGLIGVVSNTDQAEAAALEHAIEQNPLCTYNTIMVGCEQVRNQP